MIINFIFISSVLIVFLYLIIILISFNPVDPGWLQTTWNESVYNIGGILGARIADFLFFIFGVSAYIIPFFIVLFFWKIYLQTDCINVYTVTLELLKLLILILTLCMLLNITVDNFFYFSAGGIVGCILNNWAFSHVNFVYLILVIISISSIMCFFSKFFMIILKIIKEQLIVCISVLKYFFCINKKNKYQHVRGKLNVHARIYPTVILSSKYDHLKNVTSQVLDKKLFSHVSLNINNSASKKINFSINDNFYCNKYNSLKNISIKNSSYMKDKLVNFNNCLYYKKHFIDVNCGSFKNYFSSFRKYNKKLYKHKKLFFSEDRKYKNRHIVHRNFNDRIDNSNNANIMLKHMSSVKKNTGQFLLDPKKIDDNKVLHCNTYSVSHCITLPNIELLTKSVINDVTNILELKNISQLLEKKLAEYRILINVVNIISGPIITRFECSLSPGMKSSKIVGLSRDLARSLSVLSVRIVEIIPGTPYVGVEIPNKKRKIVYLRDIINSEKFKKINTPLPLALGQDVSGKPIIADLRNMPHLLVAGTTGSGKSIGINTMIISILYKAKPDEVRFIMIDPKILELSIYSNIPHILKKVITDLQDVEDVLKWCVQEMERRYHLMAVLGVRSLENYNYCIEQSCSGKYAKNDSLNKDSKIATFRVDKGLKKLPYIVIIIDEFSDLIITSAKKIEELIIRLTQKARAAGIHLILATQRPSVNVITGLIKANIPARIAFTVSSKIDSHTIIGQSGAESLLGMGDMLYLASNSSVPIRVHGAYIKEEEVYAVVDFWNNQIHNF